MQVANERDIQLIWAPVSDRDEAGGTGEILYMGQLVASAQAGNGTADDRWPEGVYNAAQAVGADDTTNESTLCGIVYGNNNVDRSLDTTYGLDNITGVTTQAEIAARNTQDVKGVWPYADKRPMVQIALINSTTKIKVPLYNASYGTAVPLQTCDTADATGLSFADASTAAAFTPIANLSTVYCRTGAARGSLRQSDDTDANTETHDVSCADIASGDTFIRVPMRPFGPSYVQTDAEALFFDVSDGVATNWWIFHVLELHLDTAGQEFVIGTFDPIHFSARATWV